MEGLANTSYRVSCTDLPDTAKSYQNNTLQT